MNTVTREKAVLAGLYADSMEKEERSTEESMDELEALLETAGGVSVGRFIQFRPSPDPRSFIGAGKVEEMKALIEAEGATMALFDNELSPSQNRALSEDLGVKVLDRTSIILDIFATRARTREGRLQVELAQYRYLLPRLTGMWGHLVRQTASGGANPIGTRGPGETQLETDRRHIRRKIAQLSEELEDVRRVRAVQRSRREKNSVPVVALIGYTNAGKSTLLNTLTGAEIPARDRLFDTLDTTTRRMELDKSADILVSDTVGFIRKLPHHLVEAFKATLEELKYADILLHVIDLSNPQWQEQAAVVEKIIGELEVTDTPRIDVYNKCDRVTEDFRPLGGDSVFLSALTGEGVDRLLEKIGEVLRRRKRCFRLLLPYDRAGALNGLYEDAQVEAVEYLAEGISVKAVLAHDVWEKYAAYVVEEC